MNRRLHLVAALAPLLAACEPPANPTPVWVWELAVPDASTARNLVARGDGFCFLIVDDDQLVTNMRCCGPDGVPRWDRPINTRSALLSIDANGDVVLAAGNRTNAWVEKRDGITGESRWLYSFRGGELRDLITTAGDPIVLYVGGPVYDDQDPPDLYLSGTYFVGLSSATGTRVWRERVPEDAANRLAAVGDEVIMIYGDHVERRDQSGAVVSSRPLAGPLFDVRMLSWRDPPLLAPVFSGDDGRLYGIAPPPGLLRAATPDGDVVLDAVPGGDRDIPAVELAVGPGGVAFAGRFFGDLELGDTTLKHDEHGAPSSPFDPHGVDTAMPFIAVTDLDGNARWSAVMPPVDDGDELLGVALLSADRALVLHQREDQVWVSAFDVP